MFENLTTRLNKVFKELRKRGKLSRDDVNNAMREVRLALLEADVNYKVVKDFTERVGARSLGKEISKALNPGQQIIKIVHEELISTLGPAEKLNQTGRKPETIMLVGLQGSGKTTTAGKLAKRLRSKGERVMLIACDPYRPAAVEQLMVLGEQINVPVFHEESINPSTLAERALMKAQMGGFTSMILDTAGRSQLDDELMTELSDISQTINPSDILLVADAMTGQEAVNIAQGFAQSINLTGLIMTKMDGDARGGASISIRAVTGIPIKFLGTGEGLDGLDTYEPERLAGRILGMGDILSLIEKAESGLDKEVSIGQMERMMSGEFSLQDFADQMKQIKKLGPLGQIMDLLPGNLGQAARTIDPSLAQDQLKYSEAIINSMTYEERKNPDILNASRRRRIAQGSGTQVQDVNRLIRQFKQTRKLMKRMKNINPRKLPRIF